jgi:WS/DGAT/MGAT family acyltransferase
MKKMTTIASTHTTGVLPVQGSDAMPRPRLERMDGQDAIFLYRETPTAMMHTLKVHIVRPADADEPIEAQYERLKRDVLRSPIMRKRIVPVPFGLHHPVLVDDPDFDVGAHVFRAAIPAPGGMAQLDDMVAQIGSTLLDRSRPLWEMWLLEGLETGELVVVHKVHHCLADGMAYAQLVNQNWRLDEPVPGPAAAAPLPGSGRLLWDALVDHATGDFWHLWPLLKSFVGNLNELRRRRRASSEVHVNPLTEEFPRTRFNRALGVKRSFVTCQLPLADIKAVKNELGVTLNDVVLALVASALRRYLMAHGELPDRPLALSIPVGADDPGSARETGNRVTTLFSMMHTEIADPVERLFAIRKQTQLGKADLEVFGKRQWGDLMQYVPPFLMCALAHRAFRKKPADATDYRPNTNVVVSNVPGPRQILANETYGELTSLYSAGVLGEGMGFNLTAWSYVDQLNIGALACSKDMPDLRLLTDALPEALRELQEASRQEG